MNAYPCTASPEQATQITWAYLRPIIHRQYSSDRTTVPVVVAYCDS